MRFVTAAALAVILLWVPVDGVAQINPRVVRPLSKLDVTIAHFHGQATRVSPQHTAFPHRSPGFNLLVLSEWADAADNDRNIKWVRAAFNAMGSFTGGGQYANYLGPPKPKHRSGLS